MSSPRRLLVLLVALAGGLGVVGCSTIYYGTLEQFGTHKRHILRERVADAQVEQREAEQQFQSSFNRFKEVTGFSGGDLEEGYSKLADELEASEEKAEAVHDRIESIEEVAADLFEEWKTEIEEIQNPRLRTASADRLRETKESYAKLISAMQRAEEKMDPVLVAFRDQVIFLKHNLNAQAIASLEGSVTAIEEDVASLIEEIRLAILEAERFLATFSDAA